MLDAIIISDSGAGTFSASSPLRLQLDGRTALIQNVKNYLEHNGRIVEPVEGDRQLNWHGALKLNGIVLYDLISKAGYRADLIDSYFQQREEFRTLIGQGSRVVIISTTFITSKQELGKLVNDIRCLSPGVTIICGGPFVYVSYLLLQKKTIADYDTDNPRDTFLFLKEDEDLGIDLFIIERTGERVLLEAMARLTTGQPLSGLPNTASWCGDRYIFAARQEHPPLNNVIDWQNLPEKFYGPGVINMQASTGCPFQCKFCNFVKDPKATMLKPVDILVEELKALSARGIRYVRFVDDNFRLGKRDLNDVCQRLIEENLDIKWMSFMRASTLDQTDIELLKRAGCIEAQIGIESIDPEVLKNMSKEAAPEMYQRVITRLLEHGINCSCCFLFGFPGETAESVQRTVDFIKGISNNRQDGMFFWSIYPFILIPLSPIYEVTERNKYGLSGYMDNWEHGTMNARQAYGYVIDAFMQIDSCSPIYSEDNLDMLNSLPIETRKAFIQTRHRLSQLNCRNPLKPEEILEAFRSVLQ